jgi:hypothetical protein
MSTALRIAAVVAWAAALVALTSWGETDAAIAAGVICTVALGALLNRWWVVALAAAPGLAIALIALPQGDSGHGSGAEYALAYAVVAAGVAALVALGVAGRRALRATSGHRSPPHPQR